MARRATAREGQAPPEGSEEIVRGLFAHPSTFVATADRNGARAGFALAMQGLAEDGAGPPIPGLCHLGLVMVDPAHWGEGIGGEVVDAALAEARRRGYDRAQVWTPVGNERGHRLYMSRGFVPSGRRAVFEGPEVAHYERTL